MPSLSASKYNTLRTCPRLFYWEQVRYIERVRQDGARGFGTLYHGGLEAWWKTAGEGETPWADNALVVALSAINDASKHLDTNAYDVAKAEAMMVAYHARWIDVEFERVGDDGGVESFFRVPLRDPDGYEVKGWTMSGKKDAIVRLASTGKVHPVEHKTTGSDIAPGTDYWLRLDVDGQLSTYIDAARQLGHESPSVLWDASRKPDVSPELATPKEKLEERDDTGRLTSMTIGKGCKACGGSAKAGEVKQGTGIDPKSPVELETPNACGDCGGTGWKEEPRWKANVRLIDETPADYKVRVQEKIAENPNAYFRQALVPRSDDQITEARADLVAATIEIDDYYTRMRRVVDRVESPKARTVYPRNTQACLNIYGRRCDFLEICSGQIKCDPTETNLYRIKSRESAQGVKK